MANGPDYTGVEDSIKQGYNAQRQKAAQAEAGNLQSQRDALARRQAQLGGGPGGAFVKAEQQAGNDSAQRTQQANAGIDDAQNAEMRSLKMTQLGQQFTTGERKDSQAFQSGERQGSQQFATGERQGSQEFAAGQQAKGFAHEDTAQATGISAQKDLQAANLQVQQLMQDKGLSHEDAMQAAGFDQQTKEAIRAQGHEEDIQGRELEARAKLQGEDIASREGMQKTALDAAAEQAAADRQLKIDQFAESIGFDKEKFVHEQGVDAFNEKMAEKLADKKDPIEKLMTGNPLSGDGNPALGEGGILTQLGIKM